MARKKSADEVFCESCGEIIKKQAEICPNCGVRNGRSTSPSRTNSSSSNGVDIDQAAPVVAWGGGLIILLTGIGTIVEPEGHIVRAVISGLTLILTGMFSLPPVRDTVKQQTDIQLDRTTVVIIVFVGFFVGVTIAPL